MLVFELIKTSCCFTGFPQAFKNPYECLDFRSIKYVDLICLNFFLPMLPSKAILHPNVLVFPATRKSYSPDITADEVKD